MNDPSTAETGSADGSPRKRGRRFGRYLVAICILVGLAYVASSGSELTDKATSILAAAMPTGYPVMADATQILAPTSKAASTPTPGPQILIVANTDGDGVALRKAPGSTERISAWTEGSQMVLVGPDQQAGDRVWRNVRDAKGNVGWVPSEYLVAPAATPLPSAIRSQTAAPTTTPTAGPSLSETVKIGNRSLAVDAPQFYPQLGSSRPEPNCEYVVLAVTIRNEGDKRESYTPYEFRLQNGQGNITGNKSVGGVGNLLEVGQLAPGGRVTGRLVFEVPQGDRGLILLWSSCAPACDERQIRIGGRAQPAN